MKRKVVVAFMLAMSLTVTGTATTFAMDTDFAKEADASGIEAETEAEISAKEEHQVYLSVLKPGTEVKEGQIGMR